jgi:two-component system OmpR family sensor kinase
MARLATSFSLKRTLAVRFSLTMLTGLLGLALWGYLGVRNTLLSELDTSLHSAARREVDGLAAHGSVASHERSALTRFIRDINRFVAIRDSAGTILASNTDLAAGLPLETAAFRQARQRTPVFVTQQWQGHGLRSVYLTIPGALPTDAAVVQVGASLIPLEANLATVLQRMVGTVILITLATLVGAGWLAASAVRPVGKITDEARAISGEVSGQRITTFGDVTEFRGLTEVINDMVERLERASLWHRRIIRDLGHDLRTPVTAMRAGVEFALWGDRSAQDYRRILASTMEEIDRLSLICDALVFLGRLQAGQVSLDRVHLDARVLAREAVAGSEEAAPEHPIHLLLPKEPVGILVDARLTRLVLGQLLDNARRYTPPDSHIELRVSAQGDTAVLEVEDDGAGLSDEVIPHLFEPFYRSDTARGREGGPGLGLTATAAIVSLHGGTVEAQRGAAGGLRITVRLPRLETENAQLGSELPPRPGTPRSREQPGPFAATFAG